MCGGSSSGEGGDSAYMPPADEQQAFADRIEAGVQSGEYDPHTQSEYPVFQTVADPVTPFGEPATADHLHGLTQDVSADSSDATP